MTRWHVIGVPVIILIGVLMHFAFSFLGKPLFLAPFFPVNESVWEHLKMAFWPALLWWVIGYWALRGKASPSGRLWFTAAFFAVITPLWLIITFYYFYTSAFGIESAFIDAAIYILAVATGQAAGLWLYRRLPERRVLFFAGVFLLIALAAAFIWFTFDPPEVALFYDFRHRLYGIR